MALMMSRPVAMQSGLSRASPALPFRTASTTARMPQRVQAAQSKVEMQGHAVKAVAWATMASSFMAAGNAAAAQEVMTQAAGDGRASVLLALPAIAVGWVLYNIGGPALDQLGNMNGKGSGKRVASLVGLLTAGALAAGSADAAQEVGQVAGGDNRIAVILTVFAPVVAWVLFNIAGPALNQFNDTASRNKSALLKSGGLKRRGVVGAAGLGLSAASLLAAQSADAATEVAQLAGGDNRVLVIATLFVPLVGWVLFNIGGPALNQFQNQVAKNEPKKGTKKTGRR